MAETYGRGPMMDVLPLIRERQREDRADLEDGSPEALERLYRRRLALWLALGWPAAAEDDDG